jgi:hypothetical protein
VRHLGFEPRAGAAFAFKMKNHIVQKKMTENQFDNRESSSSQFIMLKIVYNRHIWARKNMLKHKELADEVPDPPTDSARSFFAFASVSRRASKKKVNKNYS